MPVRPPIHRPAGWRPYRKPVDPAHAYYQTRDWRERRERIKRRDGYQCTAPACPTPGRGRGGRLIVDHIIARKDGGGDEDGNLRTLCPRCDGVRHREKGYAYRG